PGPHAWLRKDRAAAKELLKVLLKNRLAINANATFKLHIRHQPLQFLCERSAAADDALELAAALRQRAACPDQKVEALLLDKPAERDDAQRRVAAPPAARHARERGNINPAIDDVELVGPRAKFKVK